MGPKASAILSPFYVTLCRKGLKDPVWFADSQSLQFFFIASNIH